MLGSTLSGLLNLLAVGAGWIALCVLISIIYWITLRHFEQNTPLTERERQRLDLRGRRRL